MHSQHAPDCASCIEALAIYPDRTELKREYPELEDKDIRQALAFAATYLDDKILPPVNAR